MAGQPLASSNEEFLYRLLDTMRYINQGSADATRKALLSPTQNSQIPLDLLIEGKCEEVKKLVGLTKKC